MGEQIIIPRSKVKLYQKLINNNQMYDGWNILRDLCRLVDQDTSLARLEVQYG